MEEERRLAYVAYTRAENALFLTDAEGVNFDESFRYSSRFIFNTDKQYLKYEVELADFLLDVAGKYIEARERRIETPVTSFQTGDTVRHKVFGVGKILYWYFVPDKYIIQHTREYKNEYIFASMIGE